LSERSVLAAGGGLLSSSGGAGGRELARWREAGGVITPPPMPPDEVARRHALHAPFGSDSFGRKAEAFARFFGTATFLIGQTLFVATWIVLNALHVVTFDLYPFILLNLAFSTQAAYAAPLILLAQTRQADRDKSQEEMLERHREAVQESTAKREEEVRVQTEKLHRLLEENTRLTATVERLTAEIHGKLVQSP
jgi:uncharacterized membrane protein